MLDLHFITHLKCRACTYISEIMTFTLDPISGSVRLVARNGQTSPSLTAGRLEVYYNRQWGTVCHDGFGASEARTACRQLGFSSGYLNYGTAGGRVLG